MRLAVLVVLMSAWFASASADERNALDVNGATVAEVRAALGAPPDHLVIRQFPGFVRLSVDSAALGRQVLEAKARAERVGGVSAVALLPTRDAGPPALRIVLAKGGAWRERLRSVGSPEDLPAFVNERLGLSVPIVVHPSWDWSAIEVAVDERSMMAAVGERLRAMEPAFADTLLHPQRRH